MSKTLVFLAGLLLFMVAPAIAQTPPPPPAINVGPTCTAFWTAPVVPPGVVLTYNLYVDPAATPVPTLTGITATTYPGLCTGLAAGPHTVYVTAVDVVGESPPSNTVPFVDVTSRSGAPSGAGVRTP